MVLPAAVFASFDLVQTAARLASGPGISSDVVFVQAVELVLASANQVSANFSRVASVSGVYKTTAFAFPTPIGDR